MSVIDPPISNYGSVPIYLYAFTRGSIKYLYNSSDRDITYSGAVYAAVPISDSGIIQSGESADDNVVVTLPWAAGIVRLYDGTPPSDEVFLTIFELDFNDQIAFATWSGSVTECKRKDPASADITCQTIAQSFERDGLTLTYSRSCPYFLYDTATCKANPLAFVVQGVVETVSGQTVVAEAFANGGDLYFNGGYIEWLVGGTDDTFERRAILNQVGTTITLLGLADGLALGTVVNAYPGCDRTVETCLSKFNNLANCGACNKMPGVSPFDNVNYF